MDDTEPLTYAKTKVADEAGLSSEWATRLRGANLGELRADAAQLREALGMPPQQSARERDESGRFRDGA